MAEQTEPNVTALELPYQELTNLALSRDSRREVFREMGATLARETRFIDISKIFVREGFNWRLKPEGYTDEQWLSDLEIPELAINILSTNGCATPLEGDITKDGMFYLTEGYRRYLAISYLLSEGYTNYENGVAVNQVEVFVNDKETSELDRMVRIFTSQNNKKLKPMELAVGLLRIKKAYKMTHEQIAKNIGMSRQWVDNKIALAEEPEEIQSAIKNNQISSTAALKLKKSVTVESDRVHQIQQSIDNNIPLTVHAADSLKKEKQEAVQGELHGSDIDCSTEKTTAEMDLNESIGLCDKIRTKLSSIPAQHRQDIESLLDIIIKKVDSAREYVKKSSDRR